MTQRASNDCEALAGVSQEWNWAGVGIARVHSLQDDIAARLYQRYPRLVQGAFKPNIVPKWWQGGPRLLAAARTARRRAHRLAC